MSSIQLFDLNGEQRFTGTSVGGGGAQPLLVAKIDVSAAELNALATVAVPILAAPGANKIVRPVWAALRYIPGSTPFTITNDPIAGDAFFTITTPGMAADFDYDVVWMTFAAAGGVLTTGTDLAAAEEVLIEKPSQYPQFAIGSNPMAALPVGDLIDQALQLCFKGSLSGGDGTAKLVVHYVVIDLT